MATEVGSDIALIQDEDMLRKMWQQTEDFGKKKEIRMRMYKLREQRLKEFYTTGEMIQTETTSKRSSTRTHTESITDQGFMAMKTKEIRDSQSPTEDYHRQSINNKNYYVSSKNEESDGNRGIVQTELISSTEPSEEFTQSSLQTSKSISTSSKWESSQTIISVSEDVQKSDVNLSSKFITNEQNNEDNHDTSFNQYNNSNTDRQLVYDTSFNQQDSSNADHQLTYETSINQQNSSKIDRQVHDTSLNQQNRSNIDSKISQSITNTNVDNIKRTNDNKYSSDHKKVTETYINTSNAELYEPTSENISNKKNSFVDNVSDISTNKSENVEITTDNKIINELQKLDSYLSTQKSTTDSSSNKSNYSTVSNEEKLVKKVGDRTKDLSKEITEDQYTTTYQHSYQQPRISVDLSPSHEAFARSLRSTPERTSPSPSRERTSPERRLKSASPEKYRSSPEKSGSPPKSLKSFARRKLSSTHTKDLSKKRANTPTRNEKYDSSDDSDCSGATHGTYDKYKGHDAKRTLFKEDIKTTNSTQKFSQKSPSTSPVRREKSPGYSSEGSVGKEVRKSSYKVKNSSHESSPERSAFKPVKNYRTSQTQHATQSNIINRVSQNENVHTKDYNSKSNINKANNVDNLVKVINSEVEDNLDESDNIVQSTRDIEITTLDSKNKSIQEKFIIEEQIDQIDTPSKQVDIIKTTKEPTNNTEIKKTIREYSPSKSLRETNKFNHEEFIDNEKSHITKDTIINESVSIKPKEKSPLKEVKSVLKERSPVKEVKLASREKSPVKDEKSIPKEKSPVREVKPITKEKSPTKEIKHVSRENSPTKNVKPVSKENSSIKEGKSISKDTIETRPSNKSPEKISHSPNDRLNTSTKKTTSALPSSIKKPIPSSFQKTPSNKSLIHKDSKDNIQHKTIKKDLSREKVDIKITKTDSKTLIHKNSKENVTLKTVTKKPSQELLIDKKTTISFRNKVNSPEIKHKTQEPIKVIEKRDSKNKLKPCISPQSSQKKLGIVKSSTDTKTVTDYKKISESSSSGGRKIPSTSITKPKIFTSTKPSANETPSKTTKVHSKTITSSVTTKSQIKKTTPLNLNKTVKTEVSTKVESNSKDLENELPPDNFESDTDLDDSTQKRKYVNSNSSNSPSSSSSSSSEDEDEEDRRKIKELDNIRIEAEEGYGKKMTNKDALLNVIVQLPPSSRESSPEYYTRAGQPYCSVSDDASLPRYADVVSEPEDVNDYRLHSNRYDVVTDLDEESNVTVADRVSKFLNNVNKQDDIKTTEIPKSPQAVKKAKQLFESIAKGQIEETDINEHENESEEINTEVHDLSKNINTQSTLLTRKFSGAPDYRTRKEFFENGKLNDAPIKVALLTPKKLTRSSSIKDRRASFETKIDKKTPLKDKTNVPRTKSPESKSSSPDRTAKISTKTNQTEIFDVKVEEINKSRRLSGSRTVKDRKSTFENNEVAQKSTKENKTTPRSQVPSSPINTGRISDRYTKSINTKASDSVTNSVRVTSPKRNNKSPEKTTTVSSVNKINESTTVISSKSPDRKTAVIPEKNTAKSSGRTTEDNRRVQDTMKSSRQRVTTTTTKTDHGVSVKSTSVPNTTVTKTKTISVSNTDDEVQIEEIFDLHVLEIMLEKAVGYDRRRRIRAQIRVVKRQQETKSVKETNTKSNFSKNDQYYSPVKSQKQSHVTVEKIEVKKQRSPSPQKQSVQTVSNSRSPSPQKTVKSVEETRSPLPQKSSRPSENTRSPSPQKTTRTFEKTRSPSPQKTTMPVEKIRSPSPQKSTPIERVRSPSPKKMTVAKQQQETRFSKAEKSFRNSTTTSSSTTVTTTTKVKSEQVSTGVFQEQNVTDLITSSYGVGPTDDNGRPLFGLRALRKNNNSNQSTSANDSSYHQIDSFDSISDQKSDRPLFGLKALQGEQNTCTVQESRIVYQKVSEKKGGVDQLITDHKGKPLFGLKALQSVGKNEEPIYEDMPEPPVSPQLKELVLKHEKHAKEGSKLDSQPRQKPKAKFRDSYILDNKDEGLYSNFQQNGFTEPNSITLSSITNSEDDQSNETIIKSKSQSTVFQSKSVMKSDGSGKVSVTQDFLKGEVSSVNDQRPSGKLTRGHYTYQNPDDSDSKKGIAKITTVTTAIGGKDAGPEITEITEELNSSDRTDGNKIVKRSHTNDKFESIQKRFSQESFDQSSRRSSKEINGFEKTEESPNTTPRSTLVRGDSIKALQHKFQQATVSSSLKQNKSAKSDLSSQSKQIEEKTVSTTKTNVSKSGVATSFLDNSSRVTDVQDVLTRMRNADLVVESGDTDEDIEARALLNKFLGASVILHGMEQGVKSPTSNSSKTATTNSASLVNQVEKQRAQKSPATKNNLNEQELDNIWDEKQLQILLESCPDYDQRRKIRARLRQIMAEHKACADVVALTNTDGKSAANNETNEVTESNSTSMSSKTEGGSYVKTEVHTRTTTSSNRLTKANSVSASPFAKFQQLERQNSAPNSQSRPCYKFTDPALARSASSIKDRLLNWVKAQTKEYKDLQITNFSTSWSDGLAFCALIHHFYPEAFDYDKLKPENRRENFDLAFRVAEEEAGIAPLLDVEDMVVMRKPDWKCVFTYVQTFYRRFHNVPEAVKPSF